MKLYFLLGSGISIPANLPSVGDLTNAILSVDRFIIESDGSVGLITDRPRPHYEEQSGRKKLRRILIFLDWLKAQASSRYAEIAERRVNYEDLAYLAGQIHDE